MANRNQRLQERANDLDHSIEEYYREEEAVLDELAGFELEVFGDEMDRDEWKRNDRPDF